MRLKFLRDSLDAKGIKWEDATVEQTTLKPMGDTSVRYYADLIYGDRIKNGHDQTYRRFEALTDKYNMINFCCVIRAIFGIEKLPPGVDAFYPAGVDPRCIFNHDGSSVFLLDPDRESDTMLAPSGTGKAMRKSGLGPSTTKPKEANQCSPRSLQYNVLVNAQGVFNGVCFVIRDSSFPVGQHELHRLEDLIHVLLIHTSVTNWEVDECLIMAWMEPTIDRYIVSIKEKDARPTLVPTQLHDLGHKIPLGTGRASMVIDDDVDGEEDGDVLPNLVVSSKQASKQALQTPIAEKQACAEDDVDAQDVDVGPQRKSQNAVEAPKPYRVIIFFDGKQEQVNLHVFHLGEDKEGCKSSGSCSMIMQALDKCVGFSSIRTNLEGPEMRNIWASKTLPPFTPLMAKLDDLLSGKTSFGGVGHGMVATQRRTYVYAFSLIPRYLDECFTRDIILAGWKKTHIWPFNQAEALLVGGKSELTIKHMNALYQFIEEEGVPEVMMTGSNLDSNMEEHCCKLMGFPARGSSVVAVPFHKLMLLCPAQQHQLKMLW